MTELPSSPWGDAAFHLRSAVRSLEAAVDQAAGQREHDLAERIRGALERVHGRVLTEALRRAGTHGREGRG